MLDKYYRFKTDNFFQDYKKNKKQLRELKIQHDNIIDEGGMDYSKPVVSGGGVSDVVHRKASRRELIGNKIAELDEYFRVYDLIRSELTEDELVIVDRYICSDVPRNVAKIECMKLLCVGSAEFYRQLDATRYKVQELADVLVTR